MPSLTGNIDQDRKLKRLGGGANLAGRLCLVTVDLETTKSISPHRVRHHRINPAGIARRVDSGKANQTWPMGGDQLGQFPVGDGIVGMRGRQHDGAVNTNGARPAKIGAQRRRGPPWLGQKIAPTGMTMASTIKLGSPAINQTELGIRRTNTAGVAFSNMRLMTPLPADGQTHP